MADALVPVLFRPAITLTGETRVVCELEDGKVALFVGEPGRMTQLGYAVTLDHGLRRARDIIAGRYPTDLEAAMVTLAALLVATCRPVADAVSEHIALSLTAGAHDADEDAA